MPRHFGPWCLWMDVHGGYHSDFFPPDLLVEAWA